MIHFHLRCGNDHDFEAWFKSGDAFEAQVKKRQVDCPICGGDRIVKAPMAPRVKPGRSGGSSAIALRKQLTELRDHVEKNCENVGDKFAEEARKIHHGEVEARNIYGESTDTEASALRAEGVKFARIPWVKREDS